MAKDKSLEQDRDSLLTYLREQNRPMVICGAGVVGEVLLTLLSDAGISVDGFCDNSVKVAGTEFCGYRVLYTPDLKKHYTDVIPLISVAAIKDVVDLLESLGLNDWRAGGVLLRDFDVAQNQAEQAIDYTKFAIENCVLCHDGFLNPEELFFRSIDLIITERCSLRCKDCSNLMQYYQRPQDCDLEMLLQSIDTFFQIVDQVMDFRIIGGDAFMSRDWPVIVERLQDEPRAKRIVLYTNGTIVPRAKDIAVLRHDKVLVIATDYGEPSKKLAELRQFFEDERIAYHVLEVDEWLDCAVISPHNRSIEEQKEIFRLCCAKNMLTLSSGKLFRCPYAANAERLAAVPDYENDYVDLFNLLAGQDIIGAKQRVRDYLLHKPYLETCDFCNGRPLSGVDVPPAVQLEKPLPYQKY